MIGPRLSSKARVQVDPRDGTPVLLSPERGLRLSPTAAATIALCDGTRTLDGIVDALHARFSRSSRARIAADVGTLLTALHARALLEGFTPSDPADGSSHGTPLFSPGTPDLDRWSPRAPSADEAPAPYTLVAELTHRCPLACPYCSNPQDLVRGHDELGTADWQRILDEAAALGVLQVHLTGGEPLARADLEAIARHARATGIYVNLVTSGLPLERARLERLAPSLDHVQLSIQGPDADSCDVVAGLASFDAKIQVARWIKDLRIPLTLNVVLHRTNIDRVEEVVALAESLAADRLELANVQYVAWAHANADALLPTRAQIEGARVIAHAARQKLAGRMEVVFVLADVYADRPRGCMDGWGRRFVVVAPDGLVLPCHGARALPLAFDSVRRVSLARAWREGSGMAAFRGQAWMPEPCRSCDQREVDFGGCRCQAFALTGDASATDPSCALSPHHAAIELARARAERDIDRRWIYRGRR